MGKNLIDQKKYDGVLLKYSFAKKILETELDVLITEYEFKTGYNLVEHTKSRIKKQDSAFKKLENRGYDITLENITKHVHDMIGIRFVCSFISDVYELVDIIKSSKQFKIKDESDYIKNPKESGYTSYHMNVLVPIHLEEKVEYMEAEIQIRTIAMDFWASLDHKLRYKLSEDIPDELEREMLNCSDDIRFLDFKMQHLHEIAQKYQD